MRFIGWRQLASWQVLSVILGLVLLVAAALKGHELATEELLENSLLSSRWFLMLAVEWEIAFALWLLGGFSRFYPRTTCWIALLYFFALFVVATDSVLKGRPTCPCFGRAIVPPWIAAAFDLAALFLLALAPVSVVACEAEKIPRWLGLAIAFGVFGLVSLITMKDYSTSHVVPTLRRDGRLFVGVLAVQRVRPTTEELIALLQKASGVSLTVDQRLQEHQPDYGVLDLKAVQPWVVMELLVQRQTLPARWKKVGDRYVLVPAAWFGKSRFFWFGSAALLASAMLGLRWRDAVQGRKRTLSGDADEKMSSVAGFFAATSR